MTRKSKKLKEADGDASLHNSNETSTKTFLDKTPTPATPNRSKRTIKKNRTYDESEYVLPVKKIVKNTSQVNLLNVSSDHENSSKTTSEKPIQNIRKRKRKKSSESSFQQELEIVNHTVRKSKKQLLTSTPKRSKKAKTSPTLEKTSVKKSKVQPRKIQQNGKSRRDKSNKYEDDLETTKMVPISNSMESVPVPEISAESVFSFDHQIKKGRPKKDKRNLKAGKSGKLNAKTKSITCGKCPLNFTSYNGFHSHSLVAHYGLARPIGESQEFTEKEKLARTREAFIKVKRVPCYRCDTKSFTTFMGIKYHLLTCNRSADDILAMQKTCADCDFRGLPHLLTLHRRGHMKIKNDELDKSESESGEIHLSGRKKRKAAGKALQRVSSAIKQFYTDGTQDSDQENGKGNSDDEEYSATKMSVLQKHIIRVDKTKLMCKICEAEFKSVDEIKDHFVSDHADEIEGEVDDLEDEDLDENSYESCDDDNFEKEPKKTIQLFTPKFRKSRNSLANKKQTEKAELACREEYFCKNNFDQFPAESKDWTEVDQKTYDQILRRSGKSLRFESLLRKKNEDSASGAIRLNLFESVVQNGIVTFFAGGPIWASAWCPFDTNRDDQILALSCDNNFDKTSKLLPLRQDIESDDVNVIQLWRFNKSSHESTSMIFAICHSFGRVRSLEWCPSGGHCNVTNTEERLGLLLAGFEDGQVRIFSLPNVLEMSMKKGRKFRIYKCESFTSLQQPRSFTDQTTIIPCSKVVWFKGRGHRVVGASFVDGNIGLWDLETSSSLLRPTPQTLLPYMFFRAHQTVNHTFLDLPLSHDKDGYPTCVVTASTDRNLYAWDITSGDGVVVRELRKFFATDVKFYHRYQAHVGVCFDDSSLISNTRSILVDFRQPDCHTACVATLSQNSTMWSQTYNPFRNVVFSSTAAGEVLFMELTHPSRNLGSFKGFSTLRGLVYRIDHEALNLKNHPKLKDPTLLKFYKEVQALDPLLKTIDMPPNNPMSGNESEFQKAKASNTLSSEDVEVYPLASVNTVAVTPNRTPMVLFSGLQSGFGRIHHISNMD